MTQHEKILALLRDRGSLGASNFELMDIAYQYPARIHALRHRFGHEIEVKHVKDTEWRITLIKDADIMPTTFKPGVTKVPGGQVVVPEQQTLMDVPPARKRYI